MSSISTTRGASFKPGNLPARRGAAVQAKPFDKAAWHKRKAAEAQAKAKQARQVETCYKQHVPPQVQYAPETLSQRQENIAKLMRNNRAVGL